MQNFSIYNTKLTICEQLKNTKNVKQASVSAVLERIKNPEQKIIELQAKFRETGDVKYKIQLPAFIASGIFRERKSSGFESASGLMVLDFDKFPDAETLQSERNKLIDCPCVIAAFISPSGEGLKVLIRIRDWKDENDYKSIFKETEDYFNSEYFDAKTSDIARLSFFAHDPDIYINRDAEIFDPERTLDRDRDTFRKIIVKWMENKKEFFIDGNRDNYVFKIAGACCRKGVDKQKALDLILDHITLFPDFDIPQVKRALNSAYKQNKFGEWNEDFELWDGENEDELFEELEKSKKNPFPLEVFPEKVQNIITELRNTLNFPVDYTAVAMMYTISVSMGLSCKVKFKEVWVDIGVFYLAIVGKAGTNKTFPLKFAITPLKNRDADAFNKYLMEKDNYDFINTLGKNERVARQSELTEKPVWKQFLVSDFTFEALVDVLSKNKNGIGVFADELTSWFKNFDRYNKGSEEQNWLSAWSGGSITVNRKSAGNYLISNPFISVIGTIQDSVLKELAKNRTGNGFLDRFLFAFPDDQDKKAWNENELNKNYSQEWENIVDKILELHKNEECILEFNSEAKSYLMDWQNKLTDYLNKPENDNLKSIYAKLETYAVRFSLLMEIIYYSCGESNLMDISLKSAKSAIELIEYFFRTTLKVYSAISKSGNDPIEKLSLVEQRVFHALPTEFKTNEGYVVAVENEMKPRTFQRFIKEENLFEKIKHGMYRKII